MSAPPLFSDIHLFSNSKCVIDLNSEVSNRAFDFRVRTPVQ